MENSLKWVPKSSDRKAKNGKQSEMSAEKFRPESKNEKWSEMSVRTHKPEHTKIIRKGDKNGTLERIRANEKEIRTEKEERGRNPRSCTTGKASR
jgi:hypothetical protein